MNCPFCNINKEKTKIIKNGKNVFVILSNPRLMTGHLLVIPKKHVEKLSELNKQEQKELFDTIIEFQEKILAKLSSGCDIGQHYRPFIKQNKTKVNHLHFHLHPRELSDELYKKCQIFYKKIFKKLNQKEAEKIVKLFKE